MFPCCASFGFHFNIFHCYEHRVSFVLLTKRADWPKAGLSGENLYVSVDENHDEIFLGTSTSRGGGLRILVGLFSRPLQLPKELGIVYGVLGRLGRAGWAVTRPASVFPGRPGQSTWTASQRALLVNLDC